MEQITIEGHAFNVPMRYAEGHECSAGEAQALNQLFHGYLRNNFAQRVKTALARGPFDREALQEELDRYANTYQFGVRARRSPGSRSDPAFAEALKMVDSQLRRQGIKPNAYTPAQKRQYIIDRPNILAKARRRLEEEGQLDLDYIDSRRAAE